MTNTCKTVEKLIEDRREWESLWDQVYTYIAPERGSIWATSRRQTPSEIQDEVFDATAIDAAEKLVNLIMSGLIPPWAKWFRLMPGTAIRDNNERTQVREAFQDVEEILLQALTDANFYPEAQPVLLDRAVGGTGAIVIRTQGGRLGFKCIPLSELALAEDYSGNVHMLARKSDWTVADVLRLYSDKIPESRRKELEAKDKPGETVSVSELSQREVDGQWRHTIAMEGSPEVELESSTTRFPRMIATRWSKIPGWPYGRGPGMRVLSDVRALNKLKELTLKNAALAVSGVWTVVNDGVLNPYTMVIEPGAKIPVASNNPNDPSVLPLPSFADFNVSNFSMDELRNSINKAFMNDQFQPLGRTPLSALEVAERTRVIASDMGASLARLQNEFLMPVLRFVAAWLQDRGELPEAISLGDEFTDVQFVSRLAQAQWAEEKAAIAELVQFGQAIGQTDPRASLAVDGVAAVRRFAETSGTPTNLMRSNDAIDEMMQMAVAQGPPPENASEAQQTQGEQ